MMLSSPVFRRPGSTTSRSVCRRRHAFQVVTIAALLLLLALCALYSSGSANSFSPPGEFLADKQADSVQLIRVTRTEETWIRLEYDGDMLPVHIVDCEPLERLAGADLGVTSLTLAQLSYTEMIAEPIAPPAAEGKEYLVLLTKNTSREFPGEWIALPQGILLVRSKGAERFVYWDHKSYSLGAIKQHFMKPPASLKSISDARKRIETVKNRMESGKGIGTEDAILSLVPNIEAPEKQARTVALTKKTEQEQVTDFHYTSEASPHYLWYESLCLLRSLGLRSGVREPVVNALRGFAADKRPHVALVASLALAELDDGAGSATLVRELKGPARDVSGDPSDKVTFQGRFRYDDSSVNASAYALGRLGDMSALNTGSSEMRLCAADGLLTQSRVVCRKEVETVLRQIAKEQDAVLAKQRASGKLMEEKEPHDRRSVYPRLWIKTHALLAHLGDDESLTTLAAAWAEEAKTYPKDSSPAAGLKFEVAQLDPPRSGWPSLISAIYQASSSTTGTLLRLRKALGESALWSDADMLELRAWLGDSSVASHSKKPAGEDLTEIRKQIDDCLASKDPSKRADGLAAAGSHKLPEYYDKTLAAALHAKGEEAKAAVFGLGLYGREIKESDLLAMLSSGDTDKRASAFELATRRNPERFAAAAVEIAESLLANRESDDADTYLQVFPRLLCRLVRRTMPEPLAAALRKDNEHIKLLILQAVALSGNPAVAPSIRPLLSDRSARVREACRKTLDYIGPDE